MEIIIHGTDVNSCTYYEEVGGFEYHGCWQFTDICHKYHEYCYNKPFCWHKIKSWICNPRKLVQYTCKRITYKCKKFFHL